VRVSPLLKLEHFVHARSRDFQAADGLGKRYFVRDNEDEEKLLFSAEMHPRSGTQALYDSGGGEIVRYNVYINTNKLIGNIFLETNMLRTLVKFSHLVPKRLNIRASLLFRMELFHIPARRLWVSSTAGADGVVESFWTAGAPQLAAWRRGGRRRSWNRDQSGRVRWTEDTGRNTSLEYKMVNYCMIPFLV
jgi:hypothetical protein